MSRNRSPLSNTLILISSSFLLGLTNQASASLAKIHTWLWKFTHSNAWNFIINLQGDDKPRFIVNCESFDCSKVPILLTYRRWSTWAQTYAAKFSPSVAYGAMWVPPIPWWMKGGGIRLVLWEVTLRETKSMKCVDGTSMNRDGRLFPSFHRFICKIRSQIDWSNLLYCNKRPNLSAHII